MIFQTSRELCSMLIFQGVVLEPLSSQIQQTSARKLNNCDSSGTHSWEFFGRMESFIKPQIKAYSKTISALYSKQAKNMFPLKQAKRKPLLAYIFLNSTSNTTANTGRLYVIQSDYTTNWPQRSLRVLQVENKFFEAYTS